MNRYSFYDDDDKPDIKLKYKIGDEIAKISDIGNFTFVFAFDYLSLAQTKFCFDNPSIKTEDFIKIFKLKKQLSITTVKQIEENSKRNSHFHIIDLNEKFFLLKPLKELFNYNKFINVYDLPTLYQIAVYTGNETEKAPRIVGFFGKYAVFHVLWLDYEHEIYKKR